MYPQDDGSFKTHHSFGSIVRREDTLHIKTKTLLDGKLVEGGSEIYYIGHNDPSNTKFLIGTYCTFDIYTQTVAGKSIFEKCESREEMEAYLASGEWRGKAGGYAIQGLAGSFIVKLIGSYTNVVGLPLFETVSMLVGEGYPVHYQWFNRP